MQTINLLQKKLVTIAFVFSLTSCVSTSVVESSEEDMADFETSSNIKKNRVQFRSVGFNQFSGRQKPTVYGPKEVMQASAGIGGQGGGLIGAVTQSVVLGLTTPKEENPPAMTIDEAFKTFDMDMEKMVRSQLSKDILKYKVAKEITSESPEYSIAIEFRNYGLVVSNAATYWRPELSPIVSVNVVVTHNKSKQIYDDMSPTSYSEIDNRAKEKITVWMDNPMLLKTGFDNAVTALSKNIINMLLRLDDFKAGENENDF